MDRVEQELANVDTPPDNNLPLGHIIAMISRTEAP